MAPTRFRRHPEHVGANIEVGIFGVRALVALCLQPRVALLESVRDVLQEDEAQHDVLVFRRVHVAAQRIGGGPKFGLVAGGDAVAGGGGLGLTLSGLRGRLRCAIVGCLWFAAGGMEILRCARGLPGARLGVAVQQSLHEHLLAGRRVHALRLAHAPHVRHAQPREQRLGSGSTSTGEPRTHGIGDAPVHAIRQVELNDGVLQRVPPHRFQDRTFEIHPVPTLWAARIPAYEAA